MWSFIVKATRKEENLKISRKPAIDEGEQIGLL